MTQTYIARGLQYYEGYVEIKCQLDATDDIYCGFYCMLNMFRAILCPSSEAREYYTDGRCLWYLVFGFQVVGMVWSWRLCVRFAGCCFKAAACKPDIIGFRQNSTNLR